MAKNSFAAEVTFNPLSDNPTQWPNTLTRFFAAMLIACLKSILYVYLNWGGNTQFFHTTLQCLEKRYECLVF